MTLAPDPAEPATPDLPRDPAEYGARRPGLPLSFWLMLAFGLACIVGGTVIGFYGSHLFPLKAPADNAAPSPPSIPDSGLAAPMPAASPAGSPPALTPASPPPAELAALDARVSGLADNQRRTATAAGEALAAAQLSEATQSSRPFADQLATLDRILPDSSALRALRSLAPLQTPSRTALAAEFADQADRVAVASRAAPKGAGLVAQITHALAAVFTIRRVDKLTGDSPDAVLARAQRQVDDGDLEDALTTLNALPPPGQKAITGWRGRVVQRVQIDRLVAAIRAAAAQDLAEVSQRGATP